MNTEKIMKEGIERSLTFAEIVLARSVYGNSIFYDDVKVHCDSYFPFGLQDPGYAMAPNGELWFRKEMYFDNFAGGGLEHQHTFIHEMGHVWQHQRGMWVRLRGLFSKVADYTYRLDGKKKLNDYTLEQQASIIADFWLLKKLGYNQWIKNVRLINFRGITNRTPLPEYEFVLSDFLKQR